MELWSIKMCFAEFLKDQKATLPDFTTDLTGKTVIVVGANTGLGLEGKYSSYFVRY